MRSVASAGPGPGTMRATVSAARRVLGPDSRRLVLSPILGALSAAVETFVLVLVAWLLLAFVQGDSEITTGVPGMATFGFGRAAAVTFAAIGLGVFTRLLEARHTASLCERAVERAQESVIGRIFAMTWEDSRSDRLGELARLVGTNAKHAATPVLATAALSNAGLALAAYISVILVIAPALLLVAAGPAAVIIAVLMPFRHRAQRAAQENAAASRELQLDAASHAAIRREIEVYDAGAPALRRLLATSRASAAAYGRVRFLTRLGTPLSQLGLLASLVVAIASSRALGLPVAGVSVAAVLMLRSLSLVQQISSAMNLSVISLPFLEELEHAAAPKPVAKARWGTGELDEVRSIVLTDTSYRYPGGRLAIDRVCVRAVRGERIGVTGPSGSGKTTLALIVAGLYEPTTGEILVNGRPRSEISRSAWTARIALVSQDPVVIRASIADNVRLYRDASDEAVAVALSRSGLDADLTAFAEGAETMVGDGHADLSGGQRQRLSIARALLAEPSMLILDEPSSALDEDLERDLGDLLVEVARAAIVIVVSHRPALLGRCTQVWHLGGGLVRVST